MKHLLKAGNLVGLFSPEPEREKSGNAALLVASCCTTTFSSGVEALIHERLFMCDALLHGFR